MSGTYISQILENWQGFRTLAIKSQELHCHVFMNRFEHLTHDQIPVTSNMSQLWRT